MFEGEDFASIQRRVRNRMDAVRIACELEAFAPKLGNVHPAAAFADCDFQDFIAAAAKIAPVLGSQNKALTLGDRVLSAVQQTREVTTANVNLGIILLIAPLAMGDSHEAVRRVVNAITPADGAKVFAAIRLASPGGMQRADVAPGQDVQKAHAEPIDLLDAMKRAADRDRIALQYSSEFNDFFLNVVPLVAGELSKPIPVANAIVNAQLRLMASDIDSLIARKCGIGIAAEAQRRAIACRQANSADRRADFDCWLREDGNRRNPGTTADLIAAALYWLLIRDYDWADKN